MDLRHSIDDDGTGQSCQIKWKSQFLGKGSFHAACEGKIVSGYFRNLKKGDDIVVKTMRASLYNEGLRISYKDITAQELARDIVQEFNSGDLVNKKIYSIVGAIVKSKEDHRAKGESILVEEMIKGRYEKFNSNSGWSQEKYEIPNFLSHWSWVNSNGKYLLCDLQGHRGATGSRQINNSIAYYLLTDAAVHSKNKGQFGSTDCGPEGVEEWFFHHTSNSLCKDYNLHLTVPGDPSTESDMPSQERTVVSSPSGEWLSF